MTTMECESKYRQMRESGIEVKGPLFERLVRKCQENPWTRVGGVDFEPNGVICEHDCPYYLERYDDIEMLRLFFEHGNWSLRSAVQYKDLIFVNQVDGGDEWWGLKILDNDLLSFESISMGHIIEKNPSEWYDIMQRMCDATPEQCRQLDY